MAITTCMLCKASTSIHLPCLQKHMRLHQSLSRTFHPLIYNRHANHQKYFISGASDTWMSMLCPGHNECPKHLFEHSIDSCSYNLKLLPGHQEPVLKAERYVDCRTLQVRQNPHALPCCTWVLQQMLLASV